MTSAHGYVYPGEAWSAWTIDPFVIAALVAAGILYAVGVGKLWSRARGRGVGVKQVAAFYAGLVTLLLVLVSPLDALAATLFSMHMVQHLVLMVVAAPLVVWCEPMTVVMVALPARVRRSMRAIERSSSFGATRRVVRNALVAVVIYAIGLWAWHLPALYEAALESDGAHALEHVTFLGTSMLLWSVVITTRRARRVPYPVSLAVIFVTGLQSGALGAILTFASSPLYEVHAQGARLWGLSPLADQQVAGSIMWVPSGAIYLVTMGVLFTRWLQELDGGVRRSESAPVAGAGES
jgi:putative membrane protein